MSAAYWWAILALLEFGGLVTLGILLLVARRQLNGARRNLRRSLRGKKKKGAPEQPTTVPIVRRSPPPGLAPLAIRTVWHTADSLINKGIGATARNAFEDLAGWAKIERPDLAKIAADGEVVIAFSDIERSTELNEQLGDAGFVKLLERHNKLIYKAVNDHGGHVVKTQGDGFMIAFADPTEAVRWSLDVQDALRSDPERWDQIRVRIGLHMGDSVRRGDDLFGRNVAMAARVAALASGGEILVSQSVRAAISGARDIVVGTPREVELKGLKGSHEIYPVVLDHSPALTSEE